MMRLRILTLTAMGLVLIYSVWSGSSKALERPEYVSGDWWEYDISGAYNLKGKIRIEVEGQVQITSHGVNITVYVLNITRTGRSGPATCKLFLTMDLGRIREEYSTMIIEYSPAFRYFRFPITPGESYNYNYTRIVQSGGQTVRENVQFNVHVKYMEEISVDAGRFESVYIEVYEVNTSSVFKLWYGERAGNMIKYEYWFGETLSERWVLHAYSYLKSPAPEADIIPVVIIAIGCGVPLVLVIHQRKKMVKLIHAFAIRKRRKKKKHQRTFPASKTRGAPDKVYKRIKDKGNR